MLGLWAPDDVINKRTQIYHEDKRVHGSPYFVFDVPLWHWRRQQSRHVRKGRISSCGFRISGTGFRIL